MKFIKLKFIRMQIRVTAILIVLQLSLITNVVSGSETEVNQSQHHQHQQSTQIDKLTINVPSDSSGSVTSINNNNNNNNINSNGNVVGNRSANQEKRVTFKEVTSAHNQNVSISPRNIPIKSSVAAQSFKLRKPKKETNPIVYKIIRKVEYGPKKITPKMVANIQRRSHPHHGHHEHHIIVRPIQHHQPAPVPLKFYIQPTSNKGKYYLPVVPAPSPAKFEPITIKGTKQKNKSKAPSNIKWTSTVTLPSPNPYSQFSQVGSSYQFNPISQQHQFGQSNFKIPNSYVSYQSSIPNIPKEKYKTTLNQYSPTYSQSLGSWPEHTSNNFGSMSNSNQGISSDWQFPQQSFKHHEEESFGSISGSSYTPSHPTQSSFGLSHSHSPIHTQLQEHTPSSGITASELGDFSGFAPGLAGYSGATAGLEGFEGYESYHSAANSAEFPQAHQLQVQQHQIPQTQSLGLGHQSLQGHQYAVEEPNFEEPRQPKYYIPMSQAQSQPFPPNMMVQMPQVQQYSQPQLQEAQITHDIDYSALPRGRTPQIPHNYPSLAAIQEYSQNYLREADSGNELENKPPPAPQQQEQVQYTYSDEAQQSQGQGQAQGATPTDLGQGLGHYSQPLQQEPSQWYQSQSSGELSEGPQKINLQQNYAWRQKTQDGHVIQVTQNAQESRPEITQVVPGPGQNFGQKTIKHDVVKKQVSDDDVQQVQNQLEKANQNKVEANVKGTQQESMISNGWTPIINNS